MSWGYKIAFAYGSFVIMILYFLFVASRQTNELVEDNYYEKELQYQDIVTATNNLVTLHLKPSVNIENKILQIQLPEQISSDVTIGTIDFIRLSDKTKDISTKFKTDQMHRFSMPVDHFKTGIYTLKIQWKNNGVPYMYEDQFNYPKS